MEERSEEQIISRLMTLENEGQATRRAELSGERYLSLIQDPENGRGYVLLHGLDDSADAEVPTGTEFWEYPRWEEAERAYAQMLAEDEQAGEVVGTDSDEGIGDSITEGAEVRDRYSAIDEDPLVADEPEDGQTDQ